MAREAVSVLDAEIAVVGSILIAPESYALVSEILTDSAFQFTICAAIYRAAAALTAEGGTVDPLTIKERVCRDGYPLDNKTIKEYMDVTPTAANIVQYAEIVAANAKRRQLQEIAQRILVDDQQDVDALLAETQTNIADLTNDAVRGRCISSEDASLQFYKALDRRCAGQNNVVSSGYKHLDSILGGGFLNSGLYILAARPGMGKTTVALNIADNIRGNVLFVSLEMSIEQITAKRTARVAKIPAHRLLMGDSFTDDEWKRIAAAQKVLHKCGMYVNRKMGVTVAEIGLMARSIKDLKAIVVDYLGLIQAETKGSRYEQITEISGALKRLAISMNLPVIALSQLSRANEQRQDKHPLLSDLRDSGSVEQDADAVLLLYRPDYYAAEREAGKPSRIECEVAKNRHASTGKTFFTAYLGTCIVEG